jgi:hypothetical protein
VTPLSAIRACSRSDGVYTTINPPGSYLSLALGINNSGVIAGTFFAGPNVSGFIATPKP